MIGAVSSKWAKQSGGPAGDEAYNLVVADPISAHEGKTYTHEGDNFRTHNVVLPSVSRDMRQATGNARGEVERLVLDLGGHSTVGTLKAEGFDGMPDPSGRGLPAVFAPRAYLKAEGETDDAVLVPALPPDPPKDPLDQLALFEPAVVDGRWGRMSYGPAPALRDGGRSQGAGDSHDNTPVVFEPRFGRNGRGAPKEIVPPLKAESGENGKGDSAPVVVGLAQITHPANRADPKQGDPAATLPRSGQLLAYDVLNQSDTGTVGHTIRAGTDDGHQGVPHVLEPSLGRPRRLTPTECERLQAFPDGWTCLCGAAPYSTADCRCKDSARYRALGNAVAVTCVLWVLRRLQLVAAS